MEVHHHSHGERGKRFKDYFLEFFMLFLAVTLGFFAENIREHFTEQKKEKGYIQSLVEDLQEDTAAISEYSVANLDMTYGQDTLIDLLGHFSDTGNASARCYHFYYFYTTRFAEVVFNDRTMSQLLNSGNMRLIEKQSVSDSIMEYNSIIKYVKAQADAYRQYFIKTLDLSMDIFNFSYARNTMDSAYQLHPYHSSEKPNFKLQTTDPAVLKRYVNMLTLSKSILQGYILNLRFASKKATSLIMLLKKAYHLK
ncbi:MAG TPA: hypothetical protein VGI82_12670 [Chitinophagaceae bacterium]